MRCLFLHGSAETAARLGPLLEEFTHAHVHPGGAWDLLIRWGNRSGGDAEQTVNRLAALDNAADHPQVHRQLALNRLPCRRTRQNEHGEWAVRGVAVAARYRVHVFDLRPVAIVNMGGSRRRPARRRGMYYLARRAVYALGLHFGAVDIAVTPRNRLVILNVEPAPPLSPALARRYARAVKEYIERLRQALEVPPQVRAATVVLGADPEFMLRRRSTGRMRFASDFFPRHGVVAYDITGIRGRNGFRYPVAEVRPAPSPHPAVLINNIRSALRRPRRLAPDRGTEWLAGSMPFRGHPIGGHIHFSQIQLTTDLLHALDTYLAIPDLLVEGSHRSRRRRRRYGYLGEYRLEGHGGFEYRTLSSWITTIHRAQATLSLAKIIAVEYPRLNRRLLIGYEAQRDFYEARKVRFRALMPLLWRDLLATETSREYLDALHTLKTVVDAKRRWREGIDIKARWPLR